MTMIDANRKNFVADRQRQYYPKNGTLVIS
jgi:hypothetical protein